VETRLRQKSCVLFPQKNFARLISIFDWFSPPQKVKKKPFRSVTLRCRSTPPSKLNHGAKLGCVVIATLRLHQALERNLISIVQEKGWVSRPVVIGSKKSRLHRGLNPGPSSRYIYIFKLRRFEQMEKICSLAVSSVTNTM